MCQEYGDPNVERHKVRTTLLAALAEAGAPEGNPDANEETWGVDPEAVAAQEAMMRRAGMVGDDTEPDHATVPPTDAAPGGDG